jgi:hypothetical protein
MMSYIEIRGEKIVTDESLQKNPVEFTNKLLSFKDDIDLMVEKIFKNDVIF